MAKPLFVQKRFPVRLLLSAVLLMATACSDNKGKQQDSPTLVAQTNFQQAANGAVNPSQPQVQPQVLPTPNKIGPANFMCPTKDTHRSKDDMLSPIRGGMVWDSSGRGIIFQDDTESIKSYAAAETYYEENGSLNKDGVFRIGYRMNARECRRQIRLDREIQPGVWEGSLAIDVCAPPAVALFGLVKDFHKKFKQAGKITDDVKNIQGLIDFAKSQEMKELLAIVLQSLQDKEVQLIAGISQAQATQDQATEAQLTATLKVVKGKFIGLSKMQAGIDTLAARLEKNLGITNRSGLTMDQVNVTADQTDKLIYYYMDTEGYLLPRFRVPLLKVFYQESEEVPHPSGGVTPAFCNLTNDVHDSVRGYAGIASQYQFKMRYNHPVVSTVMYFKDNKGEAVESDLYATPWNYGDKKIFETLLHDDHKEVASSLVKKARKRNILFDQRYANAPVYEWSRDKEIVGDKSVATLYYSGQSRGAKMESGNYKCTTFKLDENDPRGAYWRRSNTFDCSYDKDDNLFTKENGVRYFGSFFPSKFGLTGFAGVYAEDEGVVHNQILDGLFEPVYSQLASPKRAPLLKSGEDGTDMLGILSGIYGGGTYYIQFHKTEPGVYGLLMVEKVANP